MVPEANEREEYAETGTLIDHSRYSEQQPNLSTTSVAKETE